MNKIILYTVLILFSFITKTMAQKVAIKDSSSWSFRQDEPKSYEIGAAEDPIYANVAFKVAEAVAAEKFDRGILICGTGIGMSIAANKVKGAYAALVTDYYSAQRARLSNDANIICMGAFTTGVKEREFMTTEFLTNEFVPGCGSQPKVDAFVHYDEER